MAWIAKITLIKIPKDQRSTITFAKREREKEEEDFRQTGERYWSQEWD